MQTLILMYVNPTHLCLVTLLGRRLPHPEPRGRLALLLRHPVHDLPEHRPRPRPRRRRRPLHRGRLTTLRVVEPRVLVLVVVVHLQNCQMAKFDPFLSLDCARVEGMGAQSK